MVFSLYKTIRFHTFFLLLFHLNAFHGFDHFLFLCLPRRRMPILQYTVRPFTFHFNIINYLYASAPAQKHTHTHCLTNVKCMDSKSSSCFNKWILFLWDFSFVSPFACFVSPDPNKSIIRFEQLLIFGVYNPFANRRKTKRNETKFSFLSNAHEEWRISAIDGDPFGMKTNNGILMWNEVFDVNSQELLKNNSGFRFWLIEKWMLDGDFSSFHF